MSKLAGFKEEWRCTGFSRVRIDSSSAVSKRYSIRLTWVYVMRSVGC